MPKRCLVCVLTTIWPSRFKEFIRSTSRPNIFLRSRDNKTIQRKKGCKWIQNSLVEPILAILSSSSQRSEAKELELFEGASPSSSILAEGAYPDLGGIEMAKPGSKEILKPLLCNVNLNIAMKREQLFLLLGWNQLKNNRLKVQYALSCL